MSMVSGVVGGVDTHADVHVAAALDANGGLLGIESFGVDAAGYRSLLSWVAGFGPVVKVGVEGTGSYGVGLARHLHANGVVVVEVDRPNRQTRRRLGKSDPVDAEAAARTALSGSATTTPKRRDGTVEQIRVLMVARRSARMQRNQTLNQLRQIVITGPDEVRARFKDRYKTGLVSEVAAMRPRKGSDPIVFTTNVVIRSLARRIRDLDDEMRTIDDALGDLVNHTAPSLLACYGVEVITSSFRTPACGPSKTSNAPRLIDQEAGCAKSAYAPLLEEGESTRRRHILAAHIRLGGMMWVGRRQAGGARSVLELR